MPTLSVLITYFNEGALLTECLNSLASGGEWPDEVLIHDDCSKVPPAAFIPDTLKVRVIRSEKNIGPAAGRNRLIQETKGDFLHFHDSDDLFSSQWLSKVKAALQANTVDCVFTEVDSQVWNGDIHHNILLLHKLSGTAAPEALTRFCLQHFMLVPAGTHRTQLVREIGGYRTQLWQSEDWDFHVRLSAKSPRYKVLQEALVIIRVRKESRSQDITACFTDAIRAVEFLKTELDPKFASDLAGAAARFGSVLYQLGAVEAGREGFRVAKNVGSPNLDFASASYRILASLAGQEAAERVGRAYRKLLPRRVRQLIQK